MVAEVRLNRATKPRTENLVAKYCDWLEEGQAVRILDVGCGDGTPVRILARHGLKPVGLDLRPWPWFEGQFVLGNGNRLPFRDGCFDAVGSFAVLEHSDRPEEFLEEMVRVVKLGGRVVVGAPNMYGCLLLHPGNSVTHTGGIPRYARNFLLHMRKQFESVYAPEGVSFDSLSPDMRSPPQWASDYDAICATDPAVVRAILKRHGVRTIYQSPSLEYSDSQLVHAATLAIEILPVVRDFFGGIFIVGEKVKGSRESQDDAGWIREGGVW